MLVPMSKMPPPDTSPALKKTSTGEAVPGGSIVADRLEQAASDHGARPAVRFRGRALPYRDLAARVRERAGVLRRMGVGPGVRVGLLLPDCPAVLYYTFAAYAVGATIVPLDAAAGDQDLAETVRTLGVTHLVTCDRADVHSRLSPLLQHGIVRAVVVAFASLLPAVAAARLRLLQSHKLARTPASLAHFVSAERDLLLDEPVEAVAMAGPTPRPALPDDVALLSCPGPGQHRVAALTHARLATNVQQLLAALPQITPGRERILAAVPLCHALPLIITVHVAAATAAELIIPDDLTAAGISAALRTAAPSVLVTSPSRLEALIAHPSFNSSTLSRLRFAVMVGAPASQRLHTAFAAVSPAPLLQSWAVAAASAFVAVTRAADPPVPLAGRCLADTRVIVRDLADPTREVPRGERGELCVAGPQIAVTAGPGAYLPAGDLGLIDAGGRIVLVDRVEDLIVAAGYLIYPGRIEDALLEHPDVEDAAVIGVTDRRRGNAPKAFVVARRGAAITERDLRLHLESRISRIEMPADIDFCPTLPKTPSGTVCKSTLRRREAGRRDR